MLGKIFSRVLLGSVLLGASALQANECCCDPSPCCGSWMAYADFLYWKASVTDLPFAATSTLEFITPPGFTQINNQSLKYARFNYDPGFRVGIGYLSACDWQLTAEYTRFHTSGSGSLATPSAVGPLVLEDIWFSQIGAVKLSIDANQISDFDQGKVLFAAPYFACSRFAFRPTFGGIGAWLNQKLQLQRSTLVVDTPGQFNTLLRNFFQGGGLDIGCDTEIQIWKCLSLFGRGSYSLLYGRYDLRRHDDISVFSTTPVFFTNDQRTIEYGFANSFDINVGLTASWCLCNMNWSTQIGYEFMYWLDQVRVRGIFPINGNGDAVALYGKGHVGYQGLTWRVILSY